MIFRTVLFSIFIAAMPLHAQSFFKHNKTFTVGPNTSDIVAVDLNGDGLPELITADPGSMQDPREEAPAQNRLSYLLAKGKLSYEPQPPLSAGFAPYCLAVANMDASKAPDLIVGSFLATRNRDVSLLRNLDNNVFEPLHFSVADEKLSYLKMKDGDGFPVFTTPGITSVAVADFDSDGYRDVIGTGWSSDVLIFWPGDYENYLGDPVLFDAPGGPRDIEIADFNHDGKLDLAVSMYSTNEIAIWEGSGSGEFNEITRFSSRGKLPQKLELADMNADGESDLIVSHAHADDSVAIFYGEGGFHFSSSREFLLGDDRHILEYGITDLVVADLNADDLPDFAVTCHADPKVIVFLSAKSSSKGATKYDRETYSYKSGKPHALCVADFNTDGKPDLGVALWEQNTVALLLAR